MSVLLFLGQTAPLLANPSGGTVVAGSATIGAAGATLSINQSTQNAIINWQQFSIAAGETTKFLVPNSGATLNRVTGGNISSIYGNLQSNGTLYLVNPSGIVVGPSGRIDTAGFLASTLDVSNEQFMAGGNLEFAGSSGASVENDGIIHASTGDVYLIASQVTNRGTISARRGTAGLAAGSDVLFQQAGNEHLFVKATPAGTQRALGVTNSGTIRAAAAELKAAGGNAYALAINNTGVIAATGYRKIGGKVYLTSDGGSISNSGKISATQSNGNGGQVRITGTAVASATSGTITNTGTIDASAKVAGGQGGTVTIKDMTGTTNFLGTILAKGGQGGAGGTVEVSGGTLNFGGLVDLTSPGGTTGTLLLDPLTLNVVNGGTGMIVDGENDSASTIAPGTVVAALGTANVMLSASASITISNAITWTSTNTLTLTTTTTGSTIAINAPISGVNGTLTIDTEGSSDVITPSAAVNVASFILQNGFWDQVNATLPGFTASHDFELQGGTFLRSTGNGTGPYQITDIYGLQGIGSPSGMLDSGDYSFVLSNDINAAGTSTWNGGAGFDPIGLGNPTSPVYNQFFGTFDGAGHTVSNLYINLPSDYYVGLFSQIGYEAEVENLTLANATGPGGGALTIGSGALVGDNLGSVVNDSSSGTVNGNFNLGGLVGWSDGTISGSSSSASVTGADDSNYIGGLTGANYGTITTSSSTGPVVAGEDSAHVGGLMGENGGSVSNSTTSSSVTAGPGSTDVGPIAGDNTGTFEGVTGTGVVSTESGGGTDGTGTTTQPQTIAGSGSNIVPPAITPQAPQIAAPVIPIFDPAAQPPQLSFEGSGISGTESSDVGLASSSSGSGQVGSGDAAQLGGGQLNNVNNPHASGALNQALGPVVYQNLADALKDLGDWADVPEGSSGDTAGGGAGAETETVISGGDVVELTSTGVKNVPADQVPKQLQKAMNADLSH